MCQVLKKPKNPPVFIKPANLNLLPHLIHFSLSTTGALNPSCESAPAGQILTEGHL